MKQKSILAIDLYVGFEDGACKFVYTYQSKFSEGGLFFGILFSAIDCTP